MNNSCYPCIVYAAEEHNDKAHHDQTFEDEVFVDMNENSDHYDEDDYMLVPRPPTVPSMQHSNFLSEHAALSARAVVLSTQHAPTLPAQHASALSAHATVLSTQHAPAVSVQHASTLCTCDVVLSTQHAPAPSTQPAAPPST